MGTFTATVNSVANYVLWIAAPLALKILFFSLMTALALFYASVIGYAIQGVFESIMKDLARGRTGKQGQNGLLEEFFLIWNSQPKYRKFCLALVMAGVVCIVMGGYAASLSRSAITGFAVSLMTATLTLGMEYDRLLGGTILQNLVAVPVVAVRMAHYCLYTCIRLPLRVLSR